MALYVLFTGDALEGMHMLTIKQSCMLMETGRQWKRCWAMTLQSLWRIVTIWI